VDVLAGDTLEVTVDTVARRSAFAPAVWINAPSTCTEVLAYDNFACSFGSSSCPAAEWIATEDGTAEIVVMAAESSGRGGAGEYALGVAKR
jgi:hypothetical protein